MTTTTVDRPTENGVTVLFAPEFAEGDLTRIGSTEKHLAVVRRDVFLDCHYLIAHITYRRVRIGLTRHSRVVRTVKVVCGDLAWDSAAHALVAAKNLAHDHSLVSQQYRPLVEA